MIYYEKVFRTFEKFKVNYILGGGLAVNLHGVPRFTKDIDLLIDVSPKNLARLKKALGKLGYVSKISIPMVHFLNPSNWRRWKIEKGMIALSLYNPKRPFEELDLLVNAPLGYEEAKKNRICLRSGDLKIYLLCVDDLIRMKRKAGRAQDFSDIAALKRVKRLKALL